MTRRSFVAAAAFAARNKTILLRSGWQTVNIGDIAHTPGVLAAIERNLPGAQVILWPVEIDRGVEPMLRRRFPKLAIVRGEAEVRDAFRTAGLFLHGSAASVSAATQMEDWSRTTGKPYGFFGIGYTAPNLRIDKLLRGARFVFTRETASLANLKQQVHGPRLGFAPDGTFSFDIRDDARGDAYLQENGLAEKKFIALVPRLRYTPYHLIRKVAPYSPEEAARRTEVNERHAEADHAKLREVAAAWVGKTGGKVLLCPEMTYQLDIIDPLLYRPLPDEIKPNVVARRTYWLSDEAASVYRKAAMVISMECHSPIIAAAAGTPCMYIHQPEDGIKGHMWRDIGLSEWYFEVEQATGANLAARVLEAAENPEAARRKVKKAVEFARRKQDEAMKVVAAG